MRSKWKSKYFFGGQRIYRATLSYVRSPSREGSFAWANKFFVKDERGGLTRVGGQGWLSRRVEILRLKVLIFSLFLKLKD